MSKKGRHSKGDSSADPLGKLIAQYPPSLAGVLLVAGVAALIGAGLAGFGLLQQPVSWYLLVPGAFLLLVALWFAGMHLLNIGRRLEVRKRGIRYVEADDETDILWQDIADITIRRTDDTFLGAVSVWKASSNYLAPSGPLTKTDWDITIQSHDGDEVHLRPSFLKVVPDVKKLISQMRLAAGVKGTA